MLAKNVNDNARILDDRSVFKFFASKLAPTSGILNATSRPWAYPKNKAATNSSAQPPPSNNPPTPTHPHTHTPVGASLLAKNVNDNACILDDRSVFEFFASKLAPTSGILNATSKPWAYPKNKAATNSSAQPPPSNNPPHTHTPIHL
ncbi:hypothetical protein ACVWZP_005136 [Pseudomonas sp. TE36184]